MYQRIFYNIPISFLVQFYKQFAFNFLSRNFIFSQHETKEELACVRELGADYIQGYYYGKPVCVADFEEQHLKKLILG